MLLLTRVVFFFLQRRNRHVLSVTLVPEDGDRLLEGYLYKLGGTLMSNWPRKYFHLFPNRLEWRGEQAGVSCGSCRQLWLKYQR